MLSLPNHIAYIAILVSSLSSPLQARDVYLNGTDISSAFNQHIKNADIRIDGKGNLYISAPHYKVKEQDTYLPLSKFFEDTQPPAHQSAPAPAAVVPPPPAAVVPPPPAAAPTSMTASAVHTTPASATTSPASKSDAASPSKP